jgi:hypothetical protein
VQSSFDFFGVQQRHEKHKADQYDLDDGTCANAIPARLPFRKKFQSSGNWSGANGAPPGFLIRGGTRSVGVETNSHGRLRWSI